jgi:hypothetical protein
MEFDEGMLRRAVSPLLEISHHDGRRGTERRQEWLFKVERGG